MTSAQMIELPALISHKLKTITDSSSIYSWRKAITAFFPYIALEGQNGQYEMLDTFLQIARASQQPGFMWHWVKPHIAVLLNENGPITLKQAAILTLPHLPWWDFTNEEQLIQLWALASLEVPHTDEIGHSVVDTLLQIASNPHLQPHIPTNMWSWLIGLPPLPPVCAGRDWGTRPHAVQTVLALGNIETLKSYLFLVWSEWGCPYPEEPEEPEESDYRSVEGIWPDRDGHLLGWDDHWTIQYDQSEEVQLHQEALQEMQTLLRKEFSGIETGYHRGELLQRLDHILGQLDLGLIHLQRHKQSLKPSDVLQMKEQYGQLKEVLLEVDREAIDALMCKSLGLVITFCLLTPMDRCR